MSEADGNSSSRSWLSKRELAEWGVIGFVALLLYVTGLHTEVIGRLQQVVLWLGLIQPEMKQPMEEYAAVNMNMPLVSLDGDRTNLEAFRGKVIFLNYWATWCPPCIAEMPGIQKLYEEYKDRDWIQFVLVSLDEEPAKARAFIEDKAFTFPIYRLAGSRPASLRSSVLPTTIVLDPEGRMVLRHEGMASYNTSDFKSYLQSLSVSDAIGE